MSRNEDPSDAEPKRHAKDNLSSRARSSPASTRSSSSSCAGMMKACGLSSGSPDCMEYSLSGSPTTIQRCRRFRAQSDTRTLYAAVSYTHLRAHETDSYLVCRLLLEKKKNT